MKEASNSKQINLWAYQIHHLIFKLLQKIKSNRSIQTSPYLCFTHKVLINRKSIFKSDLFFHYSITITFFSKYNKKNTFACGILGLNNLIYEIREKIHRNYMPVWYSNITPQFMLKFDTTVLTPTLVCVRTSVKTEWDLLLLSFIPVAAVARFLFPRVIHPW